MIASLHRSWLLGVAVSLLGCSAGAAESAGEIAADGETAANGESPPGSSGTEVHTTGSDTGSSSEGETTGEDSTPGDIPRPLQYVRAQPFPRLIIEVDVVEGMEPHSSIISDVEGVFAEILDKPKGVEVIIDDTLPSRGPDYAWTHAERAALAKETFDLPVDSDTVKMHVLFLDGHAAEDDESGRTTLGFAWANLNIVMFKAVISGSCSATLGVTDTVCRQGEFLIWQHEIGHVIGLVDNGLALQSDHRDPEHGRHDHDDDCVMYWAYDGFDAISSVASRLTSGGPPIEFDAACLADIAAAQ